MNQDTLGVEAVDAAYLTRVLHDAGYPDAAVAAFQRAPVGGKSHECR